MDEYEAALEAEAQLDAEEAVELAEVPGKGEWNLLVIGFIFSWYGSALQGGRAGGPLTGPAGTGRGGLSSLFRPRQARGAAHALARQGGKPVAVM